MGEQHVNLRYALKRVALCLYFTISFDLSSHCWSLGPVSQIRRQAMAYLVPYHADTQPFNPKQDDFANSVFIAGAALDNCDNVEQSDSQISEDGENNHLPLGDGQDWTTVNVIKSKQPEQNDLGPSVRFRTPVEVKAIMDAQVEHRKHCLNCSTDDVHSLTELC